MSIVSKSDRVKISEHYIALKQSRRRCVFWGETVWEIWATAPASDPLSGRDRCLTWTADDEVECEAVMEAFEATWGASLPKPRKK